MRLGVDKTSTHRGWDSCAISSDGRVLLQKWNYQKADRFSLDGKAVSLPYFEERRVVGCGTRFVFVGHHFGEDGTPARVVVLDGTARREYDVPRKGHEHHFLGAWLSEDDRLALVASDAFHVVHGIAVTEVKLVKRVKQAPIAKLLQLNRHIGKGHASLSLESVLRAGDSLYALASAGYRVHALLELSPKARSFGSRVVAHMKSDAAVFSAGGEHAVFYERGKTVAIVGLDGTKLATFTPKVPRGTYFDLVAAAPALVGMRAGNGGVHVLHTEPWPGGAQGVLEDVPASAPIADLPVADAHRYSPEPTSYAKAGKPPFAFAAVVGWTLNADPKRKPTVTHAIITDLIVNFFATTDHKLRLLFNFDLSAIEDVSYAGDRLTIITPSGRTQLRTTPAFAAALASRAGTASRRTSRAREAARTRTRDPQTSR